MDETATPMEDFCAALDCIVEEALEAGLSHLKLIGALTLKAQEVGMALFGVFGDADAESDEEEEV